jgi:SSS family solute:Na+ symporter
MNLEQWAVGGRSLGTALLFFLMAGEIYTTFSFLGASGFAYGKGGAAAYIPAYLSLGWTIGYFLLPAAWRYARRERLVSQPHFFARKYDSPALGLLVAVVGVAALIPYLQLQFKGLGIIVSLASDGTIPPSVAVCIGAALLAAYVVISGLRGAVWNAVVKDVAILSIAVFLGTYLPLHYYGSYRAMFTAIEAARPGFLALSERGTSIVWFQSTVFLTAIGACMWPHLFASSFSARSERGLRRNAVVMPLYTLMLLFVFFAGYAAILLVPGLQGGDIDLALLKLSIQSFDPWFVGVIGAAGLLTALVPGSVILTAAATMIANDVWRGYLRREASDASVGRLARILVPVVAFVTVASTLAGGSTIVALLLMGYNFVTQLFPATVASFMARNPVTKQGAFCGILAGSLAVVAITLTKVTVVDLFPFLPAALQDLNVGFVSLLLNLGVTGVVSLATRRSAALAPSVA